jgi:hypothetical protein
MEGNQSRVVANWVREHERSGKLWVVLGFLLIVGLIVGPDWQPPAIERSQQQEAEQCEPLSRADVDTDAERVGWETLIEQGWVERDDKLISPHCAEAYQ